jgi:hypothetical protein
MKAKSIKCWGKVFRSIRALAKDPRCSVPRACLTQRIQCGMPPGRAATLRSGRDHLRETPETKYCNQCDKLRPLADFCKNIKGRKGKCDICRCRQKRMHRTWILKSSYGLTPKDVKAMYKQQLGRCAACGRKVKLVIDHCHVTSKVRALLCHGCNTSLGLLNEDLDRIKQLARYLKKHSH